MKQILTLMLCMVIGLSLMAQIKSLPKDTTKTHKRGQNPNYNYFIKVEAKDYFQFLQTIQDYKGSIIYHPTVPSDTKIIIQQEIDRFVYDVSKKYKVDSSKVVPKNPK